MVPSWEDSLHLDADHTAPRDADHLVHPVAEHTAPRVGEHSAPRVGEHSAPRVAEPSHLQVADEASWLRIFECLKTDSHRFLDIQPDGAEGGAEVNSTLHDLSMLCKHPTVITCILVHFNQEDTNHVVTG